MFLFTDNLDESGANEVRALGSLLGLVGSSGLELALNRLGCVGRRKSECNQFVLM